MRWPLLTDSKTDPLSAPGENRYVSVPHVKPGVLGVQGAVEFVGAPPATTSCPWESHENPAQKRSLVIPGCVIVIRSPGRAGSNK